LMSKVFSLHYWTTYTDTLLLSQYWSLSSSFFSHH
jgi:hypothetical protein